MRIEFTKTAIKDVQAIRDYSLNLEDAPDPGIFLSVIKTEIDALADFPDLGRHGRVKGTKELVVPKTPFIVAYRVKKDEVQILSIIHNSRRWPERI